MVGGDLQTSAASKDSVVLLIGDRNKAKLLLMISASVQVLLIHWFVIDEKNTQSSWEELRPITCLRI